jgi:hypothetical protein
MWPAKGASIGRTTFQAESMIPSPGRASIAWRMLQHSRRNYSPTASRAWLTERCSRGRQKPTTEGWPYVRSARALRGALAICAYGVAKDRPSDGSWKARSRLVFRAQSAELKLPTDTNGARVSWRTRCTTVARAPGTSIDNSSSGMALRSGSAAGTVEASSVDLMAPIILSRHGGATRSAWVLRTQLVPAGHCL